MLFFCPWQRLAMSERDEQIRYIKNELIKKRIIEIAEDSQHDINIFNFYLTDEGISEFQYSSKNNIGKEAFIAIKFSSDKNRIDVIKKTIIQAGYEPVLMNEVQSNNWIMPEIFKRIKTCRFVVADFSEHCDGAYYEAGYAIASGKEVTHLFDVRAKDEGVELHFDISQKNTIMYDNFEDLSKRLYDRIEATI